MIYHLTDKNFYLNPAPMAKMIKHKDSFVSTALFNKMISKIGRIVVISDKSCLVYMEGQNNMQLEVKVNHSIDQVRDAIENSDYSGEIMSHLFSYHIGEI